MKTSKNGQDVAFLDKCVLLKSESSGGQLITELVLGPLNDQGMGLRDDMNHI